MALGTFLDVKNHLLPGLQGLVAFHLDGGVVSEKISPAIGWQNEAVTFGVVEPLYCPCCYCPALPALGLATPPSEKRCPSGRGLLGICGNLQSPFSTDNFAGAPTGRGRTRCGRSLQAQRLRVSSTHAAWFLLHRLRIQRREPSWGVERDSWARTRPPPIASNWAVAGPGRQ